MSTILSGTTLTTALVQTGDTTGNLVIKTGASNTTAMTISGTDQSITFAGAVNVSSSAFANGSASSPSITFTGDTNTGIFSPAADTIAFTEGGVESMRITSDGNVGIGTGSPINNSGYGGLTLNGTSGSLFSLMTNGTETGRIASLSDETSVQCKASTGYITFVQGVSGGTERMRIDSSGNLLVGTTSTLGSTANASLQISGGGGGPYVITCRNRDTSGGANQIEFQDGSGDVCGAINSNATTNTTAYATSSDYRLKENIAPMIGALDAVAQLKPVTWKWKHAPDVQGQGFIAHELQEVVPDCVTGEKDATKLVDIKDEEGNVISQEEVPVYQGIDTSFLVATLTAAIQEQQAIITELKTRIEVLENLA
jgi:hypothetical protein